MTISPSPVAAFLGWAGKNPISLRLIEDGVEVIRNHQVQHLRFDLIAGIDVEARVFTATLNINLNGAGAIRATWFAKGAAAKFKAIFRIRAKVWNEARWLVDLPAKAAEIKTVAD